MIISQRSQPVAFGSPILVTPTKVMSICFLGPRCLVAWFHILHIYPHVLLQYIVAPSHGIIPVRGCELLMGFFKARTKPL